MPTPAERRALLFIAAVAALGLGVRGLSRLPRLRGDGADPTGRASLAAQLAAVDSAVTAGGRPRRARAAARVAAPSAPSATSGPAPRATPSSTERVDMDRADVEALDRLPGIGPALAQRIVDDRRARGAFGSLEGLQRVRGIGPALAAKLAPLVTFSGPPRPLPYP